MLKQYGFTLMELVVVLTVIGIVVALVVPSYTLVKERALDKEGQAGVRILLNAERQFYVRNNVYYGDQDNINFINGNLSTSLNETNWDYAVRVPSGKSNITALRGSGALRRTYWVSVAAEDDTVRCTGSFCP